MKIVLFDIDGTMLWTDGTGRRSMERALEKVFGSSGDSSYRYDGKTDRQIAREQMLAVGIDDDVITERMDDVIDAYVAGLNSEFEADASAAKLCGGIPELLDALEKDPDVRLGLLTGNIEQGARCKLRAVGIDFDRFRINAFGCDHASRPELPAIAQKRAIDLLGVDVSGEQMVIIGDTPADIECGRSLNVRAIGVATGRYDVNELSKHNPAAVFENLENTDAVVAAILG